MSLPVSTLPSAQDRAREATRAYRRRFRAITALFVGVAIFILAFGTAALCGIDVLRAYASGESHWSKAEKTAIIALNHYIPKRRDTDYRAFRAAIDLIDGDRAAREALHSGSVDFTRSAAGFLAGGNDPGDVRGLMLGYVLFHRWPPFAAAVEDWKRGEVWIGELSALGRDVHDNGAAWTEVQRQAAFRKVNALDRKLSENEALYSRHMNHASRLALFLTLAVFAALSALACFGAVLAARRVIRQGLKAQREAIASEERVRDFADLATDWFCETDANLFVTYVSSPHFNTQTAALSTILGMDWMVVGSRENIDEITTGYGDAIRARVAFRNHLFKQVTPGGQTFYWSSSGKPQFGRDGAFTGYRITATDVTDFMRTQDELARARDAAEQANRAKSSFLANMSHELRTPLNAILGFSEMIEKEVAGPIGQTRYCEYAVDIHNSGQHLLEIINDLLDHSRIESGQFVLHLQDFKACEAIDSVRHLCQGRADALNVTLHVDCDQSMPMVHGDVLRFKQVIINLVTNAIKFAPGGTVAVTAGRDGDSLRIAVRDNGIGMDAAGIAQALRPFGQVDSGLNRKYEGTGLGLPLAKSLVELQGGALSIESEPKKGTRVTIRMPFAQSEVKAA
jgi:signal transduction histidine kinase